MDRLRALAVVPRPVDGEVSRLRLLERLRGRFEHPVTVVVAGAGFGKTTVLAQAVRENLLAPRGIDAWVSCEPDHQDPARLARSILAALGVLAGEGGEPLPGDPLRWVLEGIRRHAPLDVCVIIDDAHGIQAGTASGAFLAELVRALPSTAHLVLAGRCLPDLPLARLRAAGQVCDLTETELTFTSAEVADLARRLGREDVGAARSVGGWPALVRLLLSARPSVAWRYVREEVLGALSPADRLALAALAYVGPATEELVASVAGDPVDLDGLAERAPLVDVLADGRFRAHALWDAALYRVVPAEAAAELCSRAIPSLARDGRFVQAGQLAVRAEQWDLLGRLAVDMVHGSLSVTPPAVAEQWLAAVPARHRAEPAFVLLEAAARHGRDYTDLGVDDLADEAYRRCAERGDLEDAAAALALAVIAAHSRADVGRLAELAERAAALPARRMPPVLRLAVRGTAAVLAELSGDPEGALEELAAAPVDAVPPALALSLNRMHAHCLLLAGRADEAVGLADRTLKDVGDAHSRLMPPLARWCAGDPSGLADLRPQDLRASGMRDAFVEAAIGTVIGCCVGDPAASSMLPLSGGAEPPGNPRDAALAANAAAALAVLDHDEVRARAVFADYLERYPLDPAGSPLGERHLRRFLAIGYALSPELRAHWDAAPLGPSHQAVRETARALLATRSGARPAAPQWPAIQSALCFLPLPWSVELAARLTRLGSAAGPKLAGWLTDHLGPAVHNELRHLAAGGVDGAARLLTTLPRPPAARCELRVLGPLRLSWDDGDRDQPELRRARVRELLCALVLRGPLTRDGLVDLLWPDHHVERARHNLRVTLTHLRRLLESDRAPGEASYHLRVDGEVVRLFSSAAMWVDLWEFRRLTAEAAAATRAGDAHRMGEMLAAAVDLWRGEPLPDLRRVPGLQTEIGALSIRHVEAMLTLGELRLVEGAAAEAHGCAERALALHAYDERAHRLAVAAALQRRDHALIDSAVAAAREALRNLGARPDPATQALLRQAATSGLGARRAAENQPS
ncbi:MAG TPA: BTAD domain-containing putative transcriptional regulator [Streptosporangiaceae bacterium]